MEQDVIIQKKDKQNNMISLYPVTKSQNVVHEVNGELRTLDEVLNSLQNIEPTPPKPSYRTMTAVIDLTNSNPATCITYEDDAVGMDAKSDAWDEFFGHYPCLFKDGQEVGKLNRNNFAQFEDGTTADITSGNAGDVMIAFPRHRIKYNYSWKSS